MLNISDTLKQYKDYIFWTQASTPIINNRNIRSYVINYLKDRFPNDIIIGKSREFNKIDIYVIKEKLPIEIQSTITYDNYPLLIKFERRCKRQIVENIYNLGKCWFFFDAELLRYLQDSVAIHSCIKLDWFYKFMKDGKLKVFTVDYKGNILERELKDFVFISKISVTCSVSNDSDRRILIRNKYKILPRVLDYYDIIQEHLDVIHTKELKNIFESLGRLVNINDIFIGNIVGNDYVHCVRIAIFESEGKSGSHKNGIRFIDGPNIAQYFPNYIKNKDKWDQIKGKWMTAKHVEGTIKGGVDYEWYKKLEMHYDDKPDINTNKDAKINIEIKDSDLEIKIESKYKVTTINIKTEQKTIEDAWGVY